MKREQWTLALQSFASVVDRAATVQSIEARHLLAMQCESIGGAVRYHGRRGDDLFELMMKFSRLIMSEERLEQ